jgi:hypothetical protein
MRTIILSAAFFFASFAYGQDNTISKTRIERVIKEYSDNFKGFIGEQKLSGIPKRISVEPGIYDGIDELHIWGDTVFIYSSVIQEQGDSSTTRRKIIQLDKQLQSILGPQFTREVVSLSFSEDQEVPLAFKSERIEVYVSVGKFKDKYMALLAFKGKAQNSQ